MNEPDFLSLQELLRQPSRIALIPHKNPDGDAIGSSLAWYHYLLEEGHDARVIAPNEFPKFLKWMPGSRAVLIAERDRRKARELIEQSRIIFALDFNGLGRTGILAEWLEAAAEGRSVVMIDHHQEPEGFAELTFSDVGASSTCELSYRIIRRLLAERPMSPEIATCLYTGMVTDTGSFKYRCTSSETHRAAAHLIDRGVDNTRVHQQIFDTYSRGRLQLLARALGQMQFRYPLRTAYTYLSQEDLDSFQFEKGDTEGFVNYGLSLEGIVFALIFIENSEEGIIKISFRSSGSFDVNRFARKHFDGGGHVSAAGGRSTLSLRETIERFESILPEYEDQLK